MDSSTIGATQSVSRDALQNVSNSQSAVTDGWASQSDTQKTRNYGSSFSQRTKTLPGKKTEPSHRFQASKRHGDLSKLRPKSPPLWGFSSESYGVQPTPEESVHYTQGRHSRGYNSRPRQSLPSAWMNDNASQKVDTCSESFQQSNYEDPTPLSAAKESVGQPNSEWLPVAVQVSGPEISFPLDFCKPLVRIYPDNSKSHGLANKVQNDSQPMVEHIEVTTTWNGLIYSDTHKLYRIHQSFTAILGKILAEELWKIYHQQIVGDVQSQFPREGYHGISFCREQLVRELAANLYSTEEDTASAQLEILRLYLSASDSLVRHEGDNLRDTSITVRPRYDSPSAYPIVEASWVPDLIFFQDLQHPLEGQSFYIVPQYQSRSTFAAIPLAMNVRYSIKSQQISLSWLFWDDELAGFKGIVPVYSERRGETPRSGQNARNYPDGSSALHTTPTSVSVDVEATFTHGDGSRVSYTRTLRARLHLQIFPLNYQTSLNNRLTPVPGGESDASNFTWNTQGMDKVLSGVCGCAYSQPCHDSLRQQTMPPISYPWGTDMLDQRRTSAGTSTRTLTDAVTYYANLAAHYADLARRHAEADQQIKNMGFFTDSAKPEFEQAHSLASSQEHSRFSHSTDHEVGNQKVSIDAPKDSHIVECLSRHTITPYSPRIDGLDKNLDQSINIKRAARGPAVPSPACRFTPSQTFDKVTRTWTKASSLLETLTQKPEGLDSTYQPTNAAGGSEQDHSTITACGAIIKKAQAETISNRTAAQRPSLKNEDDIQAAATPVTGSHASVNSSDSESDGHRRHWNLSSQAIVYPKRAREDVGSNVTPHLKYVEEHIDSPTCRKQMIAAPCKNVREAQNTLVEVNLGDSIQEICFGIKTDFCNEEPEAARTVRLNSQDSFPNGLPSPPDSVKDEPVSVPTEAVPNSTLENFFLDKVKSTSHPTILLHHQQKDPAVSHNASDDIEVVAEDIQDEASRHTQAGAWSRMGSQEDSEKRNELGDKTRLSEEEKRAFAEAVERSLDDVAGDYPSIFMSGSEGSEDSDSDFSASDDSGSDDESFLPDEL